MCCCVLKTQGCSIANKVLPQPPDAYILVRKEKYRRKKEFYQIIIMAMRK